MSKYRVCFEEKWQGTFKDRRDALSWAEEVGGTGRLVHVVKFEDCGGRSSLQSFPRTRPLPDKSRRGLFNCGV